MTPTGGHHRRFRITLRVSFAERTGLDCTARRSGLSLSAYARLILLNAKLSIGSEYWL